jgi:NAD-dependent histone deacetylase SIR2
MLKCHQYALAQELYPGKFHPTVAHAFIALLHRKGLLLMLFTQNIDCLEREAGVPDELMVEAHGSFAKQRCIDCATEYPDDLMKQAVKTGEVPHCQTPQCNGLVKPDIVFFGEQLPEKFHKNREVPYEADLMIIMGTSLSVQPFASLPSFTTETTPRVLFNLERVGGIGSRPDDVCILGDCDSGVRKLADVLGWREELEALWESVGGKPKMIEEDATTGLTNDEKLEAEIQKLTSEVDHSLKISNGHREWLEQHLGQKSAKGPPLASDTKTQNVEDADKRMQENADLENSNNIASQNHSEGNFNAATLPTMPAIPTTAIKEQPASSDLVPRGEVSKKSSEVDT